MEMSSLATKPWARTVVDASIISIQISSEFVFALDGPDGGDDAVFGSRSLEVFDHGAALKEMLERGISTDVEFLRQGALFRRVHGRQLHLQTRGERVGFDRNVDVNEYCNAVTIVC